MAEYPDLDPALAPLHEHLVALLPHVLDDGDDGVVVERLSVMMPIEIDVLAEEAGDLSLGSSPPLYYQRTGFRSAPHRIQMTIVAENAVLDREAP